MFRAGLYARVSTNDQQTLPMQSRAMREYAIRRGWTIALQVREIGSGAAKREAREKLMEAARRREIDVVLVWRLDRWGRSVTDLLVTLQELEHLGVGFVSLTEALDLTTPAGRAMAGLLAIFAEFEREILRERTRAGLAQARQNGKRLGRPVTADSMRLRYGNCIGLGSANPKSPDVCKSAALQYAGYWADLVPEEIGPLVLPSPSAQNSSDAATRPGALDGHREHAHDSVYLSWQGSPCRTARSRHPQLRNPGHVNKRSGKW